MDRIALSGTRLANARLVLADRVEPGGLTIAEGRIARLSPGMPAGGAEDCEGDFLVPGIVDLHTDHVEAHVFPRPSVQWDFLRALMAHDAQVIGAGVTTVFDSLSVGATIRRPERREILAPLVAAIEDGMARGLFRAEHFLHLRCEISDPATVALVDAEAGRPRVRLLSVMDHTPGDRQSPDVADWVRRMAAYMQVGLDEAWGLTHDLLDRSAKVGPAVRAHVVRAAQAHGLPLMSHDDAREDHVAAAAAEGVTIAEFPTSTEAARAARAAGMAVVVGAPNYLRGGSQSGNVAVKALLAANLVDILASDYVPRSLLDAAFAIAADPDLPEDLPAAFRLVARNPALAVGLTDRGEIAEGLRADLLRVRLDGGVPQVRAVWRAGERVA